MKKILVFTACMVFMMAGVVQADYLRLESGGTTDGTGYTIHDPSGTGGTTAGRFTVDFGPSKNDFRQYQAFCVDHATIGWDTWYDNFYMIAVPDVTAYKQAAYIFDKYGFANPSAAQLAIWEMVFEQLTASGTVEATDDGLTKQYNFFVTTALSDPDLADAKAYIADALLNGGTFNAANYKLLVSSSTTGYYGDPWQDWIVKDPVPEPGTMLLFGLGLIGLAGLRRKE